MMIDYYVYCFCVLDGSGANAVTKSSITPTNLNLTLMGGKGRVVLEDAICNEEPISGHLGFMD